MPAQISTNSGTRSQLNLCVMIVYYITPGATHKHARWRRASAEGQAAPSKDARPTAGLVWQRAIVKVEPARANGPEHNK